MMDLALVPHWSEVSKKFCGGKDVQHEQMSPCEAAIEKSEQDSELN